MLDGPVFRCSDLMMLFEMLLWEHMPYPTVIFNVHAQLSIRSVII
uniref:Uncharacterized protein n=1 Tax=Arundo donax TaxID=35708 RepID=A0A0A9A763_ARUDO